MVRIDSAAACRLDAALYAGHENDVTSREMVAAQALVDLGQMSAHDLIILQEVHRRVPLKLAAKSGTSTQRQCCPRLARKILALAKEIAEDRFYALLETWDARVNAAWHFYQRAQAKKVNGIQA
jgi:hypothetical protein